MFDCIEKTLLSQMQHIAWQDMISKLVPRDMKLHGFFLCVSVVGLWHIYGVLD